MRVDEVIRARAVHLISQGAEISALLDLDSSDPARRGGYRAVQGWLASAQNIIQAIYPDPASPYMTRFILASAASTSESKVAGVTSILKHLLEDVDAGVVSRVADAARAEVFDDFLEQAAYLLKGNRWQQAGVIAGVVFEDTVRRACERLGIAQKGVELEQLITALNKREALNDGRTRRARAAAGVRTQATHAQWDEFGPTDVDATIKLTRELIGLLLA